MPVSRRRVRCALERLSTLTSLELAFNHLGAPGHIAVSQLQLPHLRTLTLRINRLDDAGLADLASAPWLTQLEALTLEDITSPRSCQNIVGAIEDDAGVFGRLRRLGCIVHCGMVDNSGYGLTQRPRQRTWRLRTFVLASLSPFPAYPGRQTGFAPYCNGRRVATVYTPPGMHLPRDGVHALDPRACAPSAGHAAACGRSVRCYAHSTSLLSLLLCPFCLVFVQPHRHGSLEPKQLHLSCGGIHCPSYLLSPHGPP